MGSLIAVVCTLLQSLWKVVSAALSWGSISTGDKSGTLALGLPAVWPCLSFPVFKPGIVIVHVVGVMRIRC